MHPELFTIGSFTLSSYGLCAAIAALSAAWIFDLNREQAGLSENQATMLIFIGIAAGIIGARVFYVIQFYDEIFRFRSFWKMFRIWEGGLVFFGGFILSLLCIVLYCRRQKIALMGVLDNAAPALSTAHAFGRIGCFLNGCCASTAACSLPWSVTYPAGSLGAEISGGIPVHPVQLYEALYNLLMAYPLFLLVRKAPRGCAAGVYLTGYGLWRFFLEFIRNEPKYGPFSAAQYIGMAIFAAGTALTAWSAMHRQPSRAETTADEED